MDAAAAKLDSAQAPRAVVPVAKAAPENVVDELRTDWIADYPQCNGSAGEARKDVGQVGQRVHADETARAEDRVRDRSPLAAGVRAGEEVVLTGQRRPHMEPLDDPVVDGNHAVVEKAAERLLVVGEI